MEHEISVVARKLETFFEESAPAPAVKQPGILANLASVLLMGTAVFLTKISLILTRTARKLDA